MEMVTRQECVEAEGSKLECLYLSLRKWLIVARGSHYEGTQPCALCQRYTKNCKRVITGEVCPLHEEGFNHGSCCEAYQDVKSGNFKEAVIDLCDDIMDAISEELGSAVEKAKEPDVVHKIGNRYTSKHTKHEWLLAAVDYEKACLIGITCGTRYTNGYHVEDMKHLTATEWAKINYDGMMELVI